MGALKYTSFSVGAPKYPIFDLETPKYVTDDALNGRLLLPLPCKVHAGNDCPDRPGGEHAAVGFVHLGRHVLLPVRGGRVPPHHLRPGPARRHVYLLGQCRAVCYSDGYRTYRY